MTSLPAAWAWPPTVCCRNVPWWPIIFRRSRQMFRQASHGQRSSRCISRWSSRKPANPARSTPRRADGGATAPSGPSANTASPSISVAVTKAVKPEMSASTRKPCSVAPIVRDTPRWSWLGGVAVSLMIWSPPVFMSETPDGRPREMLRSQGLTPERVVGKDESGHGFDHGDGAGQDARVVTAAAGDGGVLVMDAHGVLLAHDRRGRLEGHAEVDRLAVGDAALDAARAIGSRADTLAVHVELVVVLGSAQVGAGEAGADLEALAGGQAQHPLGQVGLEPVEHRLAPAGRAATHGAGHDAAERVAVLARGLDGVDHQGGQSEIGTADGCDVDLLAHDPLGITLGDQTADLGYPGDHRHLEAHGQELARDRRPRHPAGGLARARPASTPPVADAVLGVVGVVGVTGTILLPHLAIVARSHVLVGDHEADRRAQRVPLVDAGHDLHGVGFLALADERALAGGAPVEVGLDVGLGQRQARRAAVDDGADGAAMRLAPRRDPEQVAPGVAHMPKIARSTARSGAVILHPRMDQRTGGTPCKARPPRSVSRSSRRAGTGRSSTRAVTRSWPSSRARAWHPIRSTCTRCPAASRSRSRRSSWPRPASTRRSWPRDSWSTAASIGTSSSPRPSSTR